MCSFQEKKISSLSISGKVLTLQYTHGKFLILFQMVLLLNIRLIISKQNMKPKINPKM